MAHSNDNVLTQTYRGKVGNICLQVDGAIRTLPDMSKRTLSEKQERHLSRFQLAKEYGRQVVADAQKSAMYVEPLKRWKKKKGKKNMGIYQMAIKDYMHFPEILSVELNYCHGVAGSTIRIEAYDQFQVAGVAVSIVSPEGVIMEEGLANAGFAYMYVVNNSSLLQPGMILRVSAWDVPGNIAEKEFECYC